MAEVVLQQQTMLVTWPKMVEGQIGWYIDSPHNRRIEGETFIARDWFPELIVPDERSGNE